MRVAVIGAGIVGVCSAFELAADGHQVTVFERCGSAAAEASFATGGLLAPSLAAALQRHALPRVRDAAEMRWLWRAWRASGGKAQPVQRQRAHRLMAYSRERLHQLTRVLQLDYERSRSALLLLRTPKELAQAQPGLKLLGELGVAFGTLDAEQCRHVEPGLSDGTPLHAGIHLPDDEAGNCRQFALLLRGEAERLGASFRFQAEVRSVAPGRQPQIEWRSLAGDDGPQHDSFDAVLLCAAIGANALLAPLGLRLPMAAVHGYSVTAPMRHHDDESRRGPRSAVFDAKHQVAISRLGARLRVTGGAELGGSPERQHEASLNTLYRVLNDWFPGVAQMGQAVRWKGARPALPDGLPVLGTSGLDGLWLNLGHGDHGWAMACGSARALADTLGQRATAIDLDGLGVERLKR